MTKTHRESIPFFCDLPTKAIIAAGRLFDAAKRPDYNGPIAYRDFVQDVSFQGLTAPPRAVVNRWVAGVQAGLIERPGAPVENLAPTDPIANLSYFDRLPTTAIPALRETWDRATEGGFSDAFLLSSLVSHLGELGHAGPSKIDFSHWLKAVRNGELQRPGNSALAIEEKPQLEPFEKLTPETFEGLGIVFEAFVSKSDTPVFNASVPDPALIDVRDRMVEVEIERLTQGVRVQAEAIVAARFRTIAATLDGSAHAAAPA